MKIRISSFDFISLDIEKESNAKLTLQVKGDNGKIYLSSLTLTKQALDELITAAVSVRGALKDE